MKGIIIGKPRKKVTKKPIKSVSADVVKRRMIAKLKER